MANQLKMAEHQAILGLARLKWSYRRIAAELGVDRETVSRHVRAATTAASTTATTGAGPPTTDANATIPITGSTAAPTPGTDDPNATIVITGSTAEPVAVAGAGDEGLIAPPAGRRSRCDPWRVMIVAGLERGLTARRIWQDLCAEHGFVGDYQVVQRFVRALRDASPLPFRRMEVEPGQEAQVDFGRGAPIIGPDGKRQHPHLFRIVLSCSRKAYSEAVTRQTTEQFIRCLENAFVHFGGVPKTLVIDNLKAAVAKADWYDPELTPKIQAFAEHYGTVVLPTRPYMPRHKGKVERGVGYAQGNALKGRTFASLAEENRFLLEWEASVADTRVHGTTRQQVGRAFQEIEKPKLLPLPPGRFPCFCEGQRTVNRDGHVEVAKSYYSAPPEYVGRTVWARWDGRVVRLFDERRMDKQIAIHAQREPGRFATDAKHIVPEKRGGIERGTAWWLAKAHAAIGAGAGQWAETVLGQRGIHGIRAIIGLVSLRNHHPATAVERACAVAVSHGALRLRDVRNLLKRSAAAATSSTPPPMQSQFEFVTEHPLIRCLSDYSKLIHDAFEGTAVTRLPQQETRS